MVVYKLMTLERAKKEITMLQAYVELVESYKPTNIEQEIVKEYAITNSNKKLCENLSVIHERVVDVISSLGKDDLHKFVRSGYMKKTKHTRGYSYE